MITKEQDFKTRFVTLLRDLQQDGTKNAEIMWVLGTLASELAKDLQSKTWSGAKGKMNVAIYDQLLKKFQERGTEHYQAGRQNEAYAIQVLSYSLIARTQTQDPHMAEGEALIDQVIDRAAAVYQQAKQVKAN